MMGMLEDDLTQFPPIGMQKVHLFYDWKGRLQKGRPSLPVDNTICAGNHGGLLLSTNDPQKVTCKRCLRIMQITPTSQAEKLLDETINNLLVSEKMLDIYRSRVARLERTLKFALSELQHDGEAIVHMPTELTVRQLIEAVLDDKVQE